MPNEIPAPSSFQNLGNQRDPRAAGMIEALRRQCNLDDRVKKILTTTPELSNEEKTAFDLEKLAAAASRPNVTPVDTPNARIEIHEVNGHLVYYIQPKKPFPLDAFLGSVVIPAFGTVWNQFGIRGWLETFPEGDASEIWGIQVRELQLNGLNDAFFKGLLPKAISDRIGAAAE